MSLTPSSIDVGFQSLRIKGAKGQLSQFGHCGLQLLQIKFYFNASAHDNAESMPVGNITHDLKVNHLLQILTPSETEFGGARLWCCSWEQNMQRQWGSQTSLFARTPNAGDMGQGLKLNGDQQNAEEIQHLKIVCKCLSIISTNKEDNLAKLGVVLDAFII